MATNADVTLTDAEYKVSIHRTQNNIACCVSWKIRSILGLTDDVVYQCPLNLIKSLSCPDWIFSIKKYKNQGFFLISLKCNVVDKKVSFSIFVNGSQKPSPTSVAKENSPGIYTLRVYPSNISSDYKSFANLDFVIVSKVVLNELDMAYSHFPNPLCSCGNLTLDLEKILLSQRFSDMKFVNGKKEFHAHKCFIRARSTTLGRVSNLTGDDEGCRLFPRENICYSSFEEILRYIYTGTTSPLDGEAAVSLYHFAETDNQLPLKERCLRFLLCHISVAQFLRIYNLALNENIPSQIKAAESFFMRNKTAIWKQFYEVDGETMESPHWLEPNRYEIMDVAMKRLRSIYESNQFFHKYYSDIYL